MPTHTPSPRRFLAPNPPSVQKPKPKPHSGLRNALTVHTPKPTGSAREKPELQFKKLTPAKRFVVGTHRCTQSLEEQGKGNDNAVESQAAARNHTHLAPRPKPPRKFERVESIEEASQSSPVAPPDDDNGFGVIQSVEHPRPFDEEAQQVQEDEEDDEILFVTEQLNKRRRISPPTSPPSHQPSSPTTPTVPHNATTHRFLAPPPRTPAPFNPIHTSNNHPNNTSPPTTITRPSFILPPQPTSPQKPAKPLPEIFSPSRKSQKYIPDGLAATMQGWIIDAASTGHAAHERSAHGGVVWGRDREDGVKLKLRISEVGAGKRNVGEDGDGEVSCFPGHVVFVRGDIDLDMYNISRAQSVLGGAGDGSGREMRILLAGQGSARGKDGVRIRVGGVVGIKQPMWDVDVGGIVWTVGVDWVVLS